MTTFIEGGAEDHCLFWRKKVGEADQCRAGLATRGEDIAHDRGGVCTLRSHCDEADGTSVHPSANESLVDETVEDGGHGRVGIFGNGIGHVASGKLATSVRPEDVHDPALELPEP